MSFWGWFFVLAPFAAGILIGLGWLAGAAGAWLWYTAKRRRTSR